MHTDYTELRYIRRRTLSRLRRLIKPMVRASGYRTNIRPRPEEGGRIRGDVLMLFCRKDGEPMKIGSSDIPVIIAVTTEGVMEDAYGHGATTMPWRMISTDSLLLLEDHIRKHKSEFE